MALRGAARAGSSRAHHPQRKDWFGRIFQPRCRKTGGVGGPWYSIRARERLLQRKGAREKVEEWCDPTLTQSQVQPWRWLESPSWAVLNGVWRWVAGGLMQANNCFLDLFLARNGTSKLSWTDAEFQNTGKHESRRVLTAERPGLPRSQSQAAAGLRLQSAASVLCLCGALYSSGGLGSGPKLSANSSHILEVTILLNNCYASMSFRLSRTQRPSMIISSPLALSQLKSLLHFFDSLII